MLNVMKKKPVLKSKVSNKSYFFTGIKKKDKMKITIGKITCILLYFMS